MQSTSGSAVFLSDLDDYLSPSHACVNPLYGGSESESKESKAIEELPPDHVVVRQRRGRQARGSVTKPRHAASSLSVTSTVTASIADCLACSGCITTAETVLLQDHSLDRLRALLYPPEHENDQIMDDSDISAQGTRNKHDMTVIATVSPASMADLARVLTMEPLLGDDGAPSAHSSGSRHPAQDKHSLQLAITSLLVHYLGVDAVIDGNLALKWSLCQGSQEFIAWKRKRMSCDATSEGQQTTADRDAMELEIPVSPRNMSQTSASDSSQSPLITSTCPAIVCLVEKNVHECVPHLSSTKSPMSAVAAALQEAQDEVASHTRGRTSADHDENFKKRILHLAIMPCHDKKLEGSRIDQSNSNRDAPNIQSMVITTAECWTLIKERLLRMKLPALQRQELFSLDRSVSSIISYGAAPEITHDWRSCVHKLLLKSDAAITFGQPFRRNGYLITEELEKADSGGAVEVEFSTDGTLESRNKDTEMEWNSDDSDYNISAPSVPPLVFPYSSGGHADYIFRCAARELFGVRVDVVPWRPMNIVHTTSKAVEVEGNKQISARVARSRGKRDFWEAILYRIVGPTGAITYSTRADGNTTGTLVPVLRFAMAYGMQTIQQAMEDRRAFDYIEAMACPSGCVNGGGQVLSSSPLSPNSGRERPSETQLRIQATRDKFIVPSMHSAAAADEGAYAGPSGMQTTFHKVPPLQLTLGTGKGMAVKDLQW